jgi:hypothetical protein
VGTLQPQLDAQTYLGFEFARELSIQLITLSTGIIALTIAFTKDIVRDTSHGKLSILVWAWLAHLIGIGLGILTMMDLTGALVPRVSVAQPSAVAIPPSARVFAFAQIACFVGGTFLIVLYGRSAIRAMLEAPARERVPSEVSGASSDHAAPPPAPAHAARTGDAPFAPAAPVSPARASVAAPAVAPVPGTPGISGSVAAGSAIDASVASPARDVAIRDVADGESTV